MFADQNVAPSCSSCEPRAFARAAVNAHRPKRAAPVATPGLRAVTASPASARARSNNVGAPGRTSMAVPTTRSRSPSHRPHPGGTPMNAVNGRGAASAHAAKPSEPTPSIPLDHRASAAEVRFSLIDHLPTLCGPRFEARCRTPTSLSPQCKFRASSDVNQAGEHWLRTRPRGRGVVRFSRPSSSQLSGTASADFSCFLGAGLLEFL
jgi:hypothetical protein